MATKAASMGAVRLVRSDGALYDTIANDVLSATFSAIAVSAAQDVFEIAAPATTRIKIREVRLGQYSDFADAAAEIISVQIIRGYTTTGSGGASVTPARLRSASTAATATVKRNNTSVAADGTVVILVADAFNVQAGWWYRPPEDERIELAASERLVVRITAPADAVTMNGTMIFEETLLTTSI